MGQDEALDRVIDVTWHGRGGQGAVTAAMILAEAAYLEGYAGVTAAPFFGVERRGAPITATTRFCRQPLYTLSRRAKADVAVVLDQRLIRTAGMLGSLKAHGLLVVNSGLPPEKICHNRSIVVATSDASAIARQIGLEIAGTLLINTTLLGAFARASGLVGLASVEKALQDNFNEKAAALNFLGARLAYEATRIDRLWQPHWRRQEP